MTKKEKATEFNNIRKLMHELQVHQVELAMQNDELMVLQQENERELKRYEELYELTPLGYLTITRDYRITRANLVIANILEINSPQQLINLRFTDFLDYKNKLLFEICIDLAFVKEAKEKCIVIVNSRSHDVGMNLPIILDVEATADLITQSCKVIITNITNQRKTEDALKTAENSITYIYKDSIEKILKLAGAVNSQTQDIIELIKKRDTPRGIWPIVSSLNSLIQHFNNRNKLERYFSSYASHELRTPLACIRLQTEIAAQAQDPQLRKKAHQLILRSVDRGSRVVEQLLTLSNISINKIKEHWKDSNLNEIITQTAEELKILATENKLIVNIKCNKDVVIHGWSDGLLIVCNNLLRNAITYAPKGSSILMSLKIRNKQVIFNVVDSGPGIPKDKRKIVLERFQKINMNNKTGAGLGLAIVKHIVDLHHGTIELKDGQNGKGLNIQLSIPRFSV